MKNKLRVGIIGCGAVATSRHIPGFTRLGKNVMVQAVCDTNYSLACRAATKFGIHKIYSDASQMLANELADGGLDIVDICTPPHTHAQLTVEALRSGCHVLLEKPMALTVADCDTMIDAAKRYNRKICIVHNVLFHPPLIKARKLVAEGAIGDVTGVRVLLSDPTHEMIMREDYWIHKLPGGLIGETGPHPVYLSLAFMDKVVEVEVTAKNVLDNHPWAPFDEFRIELDGERTTSSILVSYSGNRYMATMDILGTKGALWLDLQGMIVVKYGAMPKLNPIRVARRAWDTADQIENGVMGNAVKVATGRMRLGHDTVIERFVDSVMRGTEPPVTGEEGREVIRVMELVVERLREKYRDKYPVGSNR